MPIPKRIQLLSFRAHRTCGVLALMPLLLVAGCAGTMAYRDGNRLIAEGKPAEGLARLEEAVKLEPRNVEYRIALMSRRNTMLNAAIAAGDAHLREKRLDEAASAYRRALLLDPNHVMAQQGLRAVETEARHQQLLSEARGLMKDGGDVAMASATDKLAVVLAENPSHREALDLHDRIVEERAKSARAETQLGAAYRRPITLEFRDTSVRSIFDVISQVSGLKFFFDQDVPPELRTTIFAKDTTIEDAVRLILVSNQLEQKVLGDNAVLIYPNTPQKLRDYQTLVIRGFYITNADVKAVATTLKTIAKVRDLVTDERLGLIIVRDTPDAVRVAERIVALQDLSDPEVMLEVEVLEIKRSRLMELGIQWPAQLTLNPLPSASTLTLKDLRNLNKGTLQATLGGTALNARKEDQDANTLANPRIRVRNKEKAKVMIGDRVPVISNTSTASGFVSESITYLDVGLKLEVEPVVYMDDEVSIKINLEVSTLIKEILSRTGALSYQIGTRGASTVLRLKNGETQILAGLISDEDRTSANKVPAIGELPVLGRLFGSHKDDAQRSEILLSITPHILRSVRRPGAFAAEFESGTETRMGAPSINLTPVKKKEPSPPTSPQAAPAVLSVPDAPTPPTPPAVPPKQ